MATRFPLILNGIKFQVNPKNLRIQKPMTVADLPTQGGVRFQIWFASPEILTISGISAGDTAYRELLFLKDNFETTTTTSMSELFYKTKVYRGFIRNMEVGHNLDEHLRFPYQITYQLLHGEKFNIHDFALEPSGAASRVSDFLEEKIGAPISQFESSLSNWFGKLV